MTTPTASTSTNSCNHHNHNHNPKQKEHTMIETMTDTITITTNNHWRELFTADEISDTELERCGLEYLIENDDQYSYRLVRYRDWIYDTGEFFRTSETFHGRTPNPLAGWSGYQSDTFFSGTLVRFNDDFEMVQVGTFYVS